MKAAGQMANNNSNSNNNLANCELRMILAEREAAGKVGGAVAGAGCVHDTLTQWTFGMHPSRLATAMAAAAVAIIVVVAAAACCTSLVKTNLAQLSS